MSKRIAVKKGWRVRVREQKVSNVKKFAFLVLIFSLVSTNCFVVRTESREAVETPWLKIRPAAVQAATGLNVSRRAHAQNTSQSWTHRAQKRTSNCITVHNFTVKLNGFWSWINFELTESKEESIHKNRFRDDFLWYLRKHKFSTCDHLST